MTEQWRAVPDYTRKGWQLSAKWEDSKILWNLLRSQCGPEKGLDFKAGHLNLSTVDV